MAGFTKGPWTVEHDEMHSRIYGADPVLMIAAVNQQRRVGISEEERKANASLIAAAPDLLAALEAVVSIADRRTVEFDAARAAIHLAKHGAA